MGLVVGEATKMAKNNIDIRKKLNMVQHMLEKRSEFMELTYELLSHEEKERYNVNELLLFMKD